MLPKRTPRPERKSLRFGYVSLGASRIPRPCAHEDDHEHQGQHGEGHGRPEPPKEVAEECVRAFEGGVKGALVHLQTSG